MATIEFDKLKVALEKGRMIKIVRKEYEDADTSEDRIRLARQLEELCAAE